jgi:epoxyqueuosine reductase
MGRKKRAVWTPSADQMQHWPGISGNEINGRGETRARRPSVVYWQMPPESIPHGRLQTFFYARTAAADEAVAAARRERQRALDLQLEPIAATPSARSANDWTVAVKQAALDAGAEDAGVTRMRADFVFEGHTVPAQKWMIVIALAHDYAAIASAPSSRALTEITLQYARGIRTAKMLASFIRRHGHDALPYGGPMAGSFLLIPAAIEAGLGELGKHGSMIHRRLGASFRLACVLTGLPLVADGRDIFGADDFCTHCRVCVDACPPDAIAAHKQLVRGDQRWYVDFDKCLPYFNENQSCAICLAVCPFSRPQIGPRLVDKLALRRTRRG